MTPPPEPPTGRLTIDEPPRLPAPDGGGSVVTGAIPMLGSLGSVALVASLGGGSSEVRVVAAGLFLLTTLAYLAIQLDRHRADRRRRVATARRSYLRHLAVVRGAVRDTAAAQRAALEWLHPPPRALPAVAAEGSRVGERRTNDPAFLEVRYGVGRRPLSVELVAPADLAADDADPAAVSAVRRLLATHALQPALPVTLHLDRLHRIALTGAPAVTRAAARSLVCAAALFHSPEHLAVAVLGDDDTCGEWEWVKWLPHARSAGVTDAVGAARMVRPSVDELIRLLPFLASRPRFTDPDGAGGDPALPHLLLVVDRPASSYPLLPPGGRRGVTVVEVAAPDEPATAGVMGLDLGAEHEPVPGAPNAAGDPGVAARAVRLRAGPEAVLADLCDTATAEALARRLTARHPVEEPGPGQPAPPDLAALLGVGAVERFEPARAWARRPPRDRLRVPVGVGTDGAVHLDLKESAHQGMGPHGLVVGATGSGKSEFLRTLLTALAMTHGPDELNLVLVDFKGGATFAGMAGLPHVAAVITNLADDLVLVDRMHDALAGEMVRRQEVLRTAGGFASAWDLAEARARGAELPALPSLLVVVDEFSELLSAKPELTDLFVAIGRLGRSLGIHLLLASQRLEEGRLRGLDSHLSYRVGLRTFTAQESRAALGVPAAAELPPVPGLGYLRPDPATLTRFQTAYVSGPVTPVGRRRSQPGGPLVLPFVARTVRAGPAREEPPRPQRSAASLLDTAVGRMRDCGPPAHRVWLPPLDAPEPLDRLLAAVPQGALQVAVGTVDRPREQRRDPLVLDLRGARGHVGIVGGPRSGKSTVLHALVGATTLTHSPLAVQWYLLDLGGALGGLAGLPHVAGVAARAEGDVVRRVIAQVRSILDDREMYFREHGIDSIAAYRRLLRERRGGDGHGDVFLGIDGWTTLRADYDHLELEVHQLAQRGLAYGVHLAVASPRWSDFRPSLRDQLGTRLELRLGDPVDSEFGRAVAETVPVGRPGRGLVGSARAAHHFLAALPRIDGIDDPASAGAGLAHLVTSVARAWTGPEPPRLRLLPTTVSLDDVRRRAAGSTAAAPPGHLLLGLDEARLAPAALDPCSERHLLVFGDGGSGKTALLRTYLREVVRTRTSAEVQVVVVDYRRSLLGEVPEGHLLHYLTSADEARTALGELAGYLRGRLPGPGVTAAQLRTRSWWSGAEVVVVVDDYELVATTQGSPLAALVPLLGQGADVGLNVVVARRSGGAGRALFEPVVQALRDVGAPGILLSGSPEEGPLVGTLRPVAAPPGRARLVARTRDPTVVQVAWTDPRASGMQP